MIDFEWNPGNLQHIPPARRITPEDCAAAFADPRALWRSAYWRGDEPRWAVVGATKAGRIIVVIYTIRVGHFRVITAYPASGRSAERAYREQT
jgi:uncharacterized DUF497 family protein